MSLLLAFLTVVIGLIPLYFTRRGGLITGTGVIALLVTWWLYYIILPSLVWPLGGLAGFVVVLLWIASVILGATDEDIPGAVFVLPVGGVLLFIGVSLFSSGIFRSGAYYRMIGNVEKREWTKDVQPKDPRHVRLVPRELAFYLATKQLGEANGTVGSQFSISKSDLTLQLIHGELWYVAPLDFKGFRAWTATNGAPGYVMIHGEDPDRQVIVKTDAAFRYTKGAFFGDNLERLLWGKGYIWKGLVDYSFEIDESNKAWWVVTVFRPTIGWSGKEVQGVVTVDPTTGADHFYAVGEVPSWVDRVYPKGFVESYINWYGEYASGWWNAVWSHQNIFHVEPGEDKKQDSDDEPGNDAISIAYGADGQPYWVAGITSNNTGDKSLVGVTYTNSRTGKTILYHAIGGTEGAVIDLVNNKVSYRKLHGASPVLYNIYGVMTGIVPLLGESHTFQGVAFVDIQNMRVVDGDNLEDAIAKYQQLLASGAGHIAPEKEHALEEIRGMVARIAADNSGGTTTYYICLQGVQHIFTGNRQLSPKLPITRVGDEVVMKYEASGEDITPLRAFDNTFIVLQATPAQKEVRQAAAARQENEEVRQTGQDLRGELQSLSNEELGRLAKEIKQKKNQ